MEILGIGNAIVDVICKVDDDFITKNNLTKSTMKLIFDDNEFKNLLSNLKIEKTVSGGSVANSIVGLSQLGNEVGFIGKVKISLKLFDFIHSLDNEKLARKISEEQKKQNLETKLFIQVNIGNESQKNGIHVSKLGEFYNYCKELSLNIVGIMCIPPINEDPKISFSRMNYLKKKMNFKELSMGMSADYLDAIKYNSTFLRIGSNIFGSRN